MVYMLIALRHASEVYAEVPDRTIVITSANDGTHAQGSRHYTNEALDVRTKSFRSSADKQVFRAKLSADLGDQFTVLLEDEGGPSEHLHIQVRKGHIFVQEAVDAG